MGGSAFHFLRTPRMPPALYIQVRDSTYALLLQHFKYVATPIEAPGKLSFGDIDVTVAEPCDSPQRESVVGAETGEELSQWLKGVLHANHVLHDKGSSIWNLAIPWPVDFELPTPSEAEGEREGAREEEDDAEVTRDEKERQIEDDRKEEEDPSREKHIQIDVHICPSPALFHWSLFHSAHGDLWNILRSIISKQHLKATDQGFYLVDAAIEPLNRNRARTLLTTDPSLVLRFLDLDESRFWRAFASPHDLFEYIASCRLFSLLEVPAEEEVEETAEKREGEIQPKKKPKALNPYKRHLFTLWLEDFLPYIQHPDRASAYQRPLPSPSNVLGQVFAAFPAAEAPYRDNHNGFFLERHCDALFRTTIKSSVPADAEPQLRAAAIKTLRRLILDNDGEVLAASDVGENMGDSFTRPVPRRAQDGYFDERAVGDFVAAEWQVAGRIGMQRQKEKAIESMRRKEEERRRKREELTRGQDQHQT
ncbi:hypothetical protein PVAG01_01370 [Phlyctema vagabunda]|uniref:Uncharacterized protein n=1 Tax=Phlyctema vagabunda TaxID=108571 RepID=A0ABR4PWZ3_9HELO